MDTFKQIQILEEIEQLSKQIAGLIIEKSQNLNNFNERLKILYIRMDKLNIELKRLIPIEKQIEKDS
jgi:hypothetical protein